MNVTKLASEFEMDAVLIRAIKLLHSTKKHKLNLRSIHNKTLKDMKQSLSREIRKTICKRSKKVKTQKNSKSSKNTKKEKLPKKSSSSSSSTKVKKSKHSKDSKVFHHRHMVLTWVLILPPSTQRDDRSSSKKSKERSSDKSKDKSKSSKKKLSSSKHTSKSKTTSSSSPSTPKSTNSTSKSSFLTSKSSAVATVNKSVDIVKAVPPPAVVNDDDDDTTEDETDLISGKSGFSADGEDQSCKVCKKTNFNSRNQLVECQECHNLYHQECHTPKMLSADIVDPRFVWYCAKCSHQMNKMTIKTSLRTVDPDNSSNGSSTGSGMHLNSPKAFKRFDMSKSLLKEGSRTSSPTITPTGGAPITNIMTLNSKQKGLLGMAANLSRNFAAAAASSSDKPKHSISFLQNLPNPVKATKRPSKSTPKEMSKVKKRKSVY